MLDKVKELFSFAMGVSLDEAEEDRQKRPSGKALTVEETLLLASGMDLKAIRSRRSNPVFLKLAPNTYKPEENFSAQQPKQPEEECKILGKQQAQTEQCGKLSNSQVAIKEPLTKEGLVMLDDASHKQRSNFTKQKVLHSEVSSETNERSAMKDSIQSKTLSIITSEAEKSSQMSGSLDVSFQFINAEELSLLLSDNSLEYQKSESPLANYWESIQNDLIIADTKRRFFMSVPKPLGESKINYVTTVVSGIHFNLPDFYQPRKLIGRGAYASVVEALDRRSDKIVAIKRNRGFLNDVGDAKRILRELKLWMWFDHQDVCKLLDVIPILHKNIFSFEDIYLVIERMDADLNQALQCSELLQSQCQVIIYQILRSLKYVHSANVIHRDLKPQNILINALECNTKITDFGCSRPLGLEHPCPDVLTEYVVTRWYRSPEIYLCSHKYDKPCDLWALGCIFAEMYRKGKPLFPGPKSHKRQLQLIFSIVGMPKSLDWITNPRALKFMRTLKSLEGIPLKKLCPGICSDGADLLSRLLEPNPKDRISVEDALAHPYVSNFRDESTELECEPFDIAYERDPRVKSKRGLRMMLYETVKNWLKSSKDSTC